MSFLSPFFLLGLIPWAAVCVWLLWGRRQRTDVPFLEFWRDAAEETHARRRMKVPPVAVALAITAMFLAIVAAAQPLLRRVGLARGTRITVIVDRGITMSAAENQTIRFRALAKKAQRELRAAGLDAGTVNLVTVPGEPTAQAVSGDWAASVASLPPTALQTSDELQSAIAARFSAGDGMILVLSDQNLHRRDPRLIQMAPHVTPEDIGIVSLSARATPRAQVMVCIRNQSSQSSAPLVVQSGGQKQARLVELPARGAEQNYFIDMPQLGDTVEAKLDVRDDLFADDRAWLVRERTWPRIAAGEWVGPELRRMTDVYESRHAPSEGSPTLAIVSQFKDAPPKGPAVVVAAALRAPAGGATQTFDHPITRHINWEALASSLSWNPDAPEGWEPLVSVGGHTLVAAREQPARQVWVGIGGSNWPASADFVIFWANVFDWAGQGAERFSRHNLEDLTAQWHPIDANSTFGYGQPGIYENGSKQFAFNATAPDLAPPPQSDWHQAFATWNREIRRGIALGPFAILLALACLTVSAMTWRRSRREQHLSSSNFDRIQEPQGLLSR